MAKQLPNNLDDVIDKRYSENNTFEDNVSEKESNKINQIIARRKIEERLEQQRLKKELGDFDDWD